MFNNELMADVHFIVGPLGESQKIPAHKVQIMVKVASNFVVGINICSQFSAL